MNSPTFVQKREHPRVPVSWPVTMVTPEGDIDGMIENISTGGPISAAGHRSCKKISSSCRSWLKTESIHG
jgi:hypothetical protein